MILLRIQRRTVGRKGRKDPSSISELSCLSVTCTIFAIRATSYHGEALDTLIQYTADLIGPCQTACGRNFIPPDAAPT